MTVPPMPKGFDDSTAWMAIHYPFKAVGIGEPIPIMDRAVIDWQRDNQDRVKAAMVAANNE